MIISSAGSASMAVYAEPPPMRTSSAPRVIWDRCPQCDSTDVTYDHSQFTTNATCEQCDHIGPYSTFRTPMVVLP